MPASAALHFTIALRAARSASSSDPRRISLLPSSMVMRQGELALQRLRASFRAALNSDLTRIGIKGSDLRDIGELQKVKALGDAGPDLGGVAVDRLLAGEDDVRRAEAISDFRDRLR